MKKCFRCENVYPYEDYYKNNRTKDGYATYCKHCCKREQKKYHARPQVKREDARKLIEDLTKSGKTFSCSTCKTIKPAKDFYTQRDRGKVKLNTSICKRCQCDYQRNKRFGISTEEFNNMLLQQDNKCKICRITHEDYKKQKNKVFAVDHCHKTGKIRGLLCCNCNKALGHFFDNDEYVARALQYLIKEGDIV